MALLKWNLGRSIVSQLTRICPQAEVTSLLTRLPTAVGTGQHEPSTSKLFCRSSSLFATPPIAWTDQENPTRNYSLSSALFSSKNICDGFGSNTGDIDKKAVKDNIYSCKNKEILACEDKKPKDKKKDDKKKDTPKPKKESKDKKSKKVLCWEEAKEKPKKEVKKEKPKKEEAKKKDECNGEAKKEVKKGGKKKEEAKKKEVCNGEAKKDGKKGEKKKEGDKKGEKKKEGDKKGDKKKDDGKKKKK